jgi:NAD(P)H-hydrate repair Nnr-like enzyme with NAD(P)H-hydrate dehydratase domain
MSRSLRAESSTAVDAAVLHDHPLPDPHARANKDGRGSVLVIGGARETPGGILLAGMAALRSGAGRICLATVASRCAALAIAVPEARVIELDETDDGAIAPGAGVGLRELAAESDAVVVGTGSLDADRTGELVRVILDGRPHSGTLVVDAAALPGLRTDRDLVREHAGEVVLTPNPRRRTGAPWRSAAPTRGSRRRRPRASSTAPAAWCWPRPARVTWSPGRSRVCSHAARPR